MLIALACTAPQAPETPPRDEVHGDTSVEQLPGVDPVFDPERVHTLQLTVGEQELQALRDAPKEWVRAGIRFDDVEIDAVGLRIKGSSSFQPVDQKPAWKLDMDRFDQGRTLLGLERLTLNNEVWDPTMMAEAMSYRAWRESGSLAPRTGYVAVTLNDRYLGLYAIIETMDQDFMEARDMRGSIWEMTRNCDFTGDCSCFDPQSGPAPLEDVATGCEQGLAAFDLDRLVAFLAVEKAVNHPDSYSWNLNNFFVVHDGDALALSPWGADSTFIYAYPPSTPNPDCEPLYLDVDEHSWKGQLRSLCLADADCAQAYADKLLEVADWMEEVDLVGAMEANRELLEPWAQQETHVNWTLEDRRARVDCFLEWTRARPDELRGL